MTELALDVTLVRYRALREAFNTDPDVYLCSSISKGLTHPTYRKLVEMGPKVLPYLLEDIRAGVGKGVNYRERQLDATYFWWHAVHAVEEILNESPEIPEGSRGRLPEISRIYGDWLEAKLT